MPLRLHDILALTGLTTPSHWVPCRSLLSAYMVLVVVQLSPPS